MAHATAKQERWIDAQRVGLASYAYCVTPGRYREQEDVLALLRRYLTEIPRLRGWDETYFLRQLPPSVLSLLARDSNARGTRRVRSARRGRTGVAHRDGWAVAVRQGTNLGSSPLARDFECRAASAFG